MFLQQEQQANLYVDLIGENANPLHAVVYGPLGEKTLSHSTFSLCV